MLPTPSSPTDSVSSSDLDTESTGSFFHDRSTTLGTLMGVTFPAITFRAPAHSRDPQATVAVASARTINRNNNNNNKIKRTPVELRRRRWWRLCSDGVAKPASLGEFLEVERRFGDVAFFGNAAAEQAPRNGLFADGRVLPPAAEVDDRASTAGIFCSRFPVSLTGICSGGVG